MNKIWETAFAIIGSVGGAGVIIWSISSYLGKLWADRLLQKKSQEFEREIEAYKQELTILTEKYKTEAEKQTLISIVQFETEYNIYKNIFEALFNFTDSSSRLFPRFDLIPLDPDDAREEYIKRYKFYCESFNKYSETVEINSPFIPEKLYDMFINLKKIAQGIACTYEDIKIVADEAFKDDYKQIEANNRKETEELLKDIKQIKIDVRNYLADLKVSSDRNNS